jgi:hypothetical protein
MVTLTYPASQYLLSTGSALDAKYPSSADERGGGGRTLRQATINWQRFLAYALNIATLPICASGLLAANPALPSIGFVTRLVVLQCPTAFWSRTLLDW